MNNCSSIFRCLRKQLWIALTPSAICLLPVGCSSEPSTTQDATESVKMDMNALATHNAEQQAFSIKGADDDVRHIQDALDARYKASNIIHSFETQFGETIDCIDYYAQQGIRALTAKGMSIPAPQRAAISAATRKSLPNFMFNGKADRHGKARSCPDGTVPMLRVTVDDVRAAGGLDAFNRLHSQKRPPPRDDAFRIAPEISRHAHIVQKFTGNANITRTVSNMAVFAPGMSQVSDFSISQTWTYAGTGYNVDGQRCTTDCLQTVEAGWIVFPVLFKTNNPAAPHLFTFATNDGYLSGCWNNDATGSCLPWVAHPGALVTPGMTLPSGVVGGAQVDMQVNVSYVSGSGWCLSVWNILSPPGGSAVGCWPSSDFTGTMQTAATYFQVGGEVYGDLGVPMGSGSLPNAGFGRAAFHHDYTAYISSSGWNYNFVPREMLAQLSYGMSTTEAPGATSWHNWFYFGNEPLIGWETGSLLLK